jgi:hypothetical protein
MQMTLKVKKKEIYWMGQIVCTKLIILGQNMPTNTDKLYNLRVKKKLTRNCVKIKETFYGWNFKYA